MKRYIVNVWARRIHDREHLTERCNTDQIKARRDADAAEIFALEARGYRRCTWCSR
ncbi:MAG TPA: hypothetical protein VI729_08115 [Anaerolineales bacterium]|nr:hypothetical protein [Anaerolineales bacterium]